MVDRVDCVGLHCPHLIVRVSAAMREIPSGARLEITADEPGFPSELKAWTRVLGHTLESLEASGSNLVARVRKK